ncbi:MAG: alpha/beta fold hydrolase [Pseudomonadota bacterium]
MRDLLLIPGLLNNAALFSGQVNELSNYCNFTIADHTKFETIAQIAEDILENQNAPEHFVLGGLSMGGYIAMEILRQAPERVRGLILMNTSARKDTPEQTERRKSFIKVTETGRFRGVTHHLLPNLVHEQFVNDPLVSNVIFDMTQEVGREGFIRQQRAIINRIDSRNSLKRVNVPACVIVGDDDKLTPPDRAREMAQLLPSAELHIIAKCGHLSALEHPGEVSEIIATFMMKCRNLYQVP